MSQYLKPGSENRHGAGPHSVQPHLLPAINADDTLVSIYGPETPIVLAEFYAQCESARRISVIGDRPFILTSRITDWFHATHGDPAQANFERLLRVVYPRSYASQSISLHHHTNTSDDKCWLLTFAILLLLSRSHPNLGFAINHFFEFNILDQRLGTISEEELVKCFTYLPIDTDARVVAHEFWTLQWQFCAHEAINEAYARGRPYDPEKFILPITEKVLLTEGGTGVIWMIAVPVECIPPSLEQRIQRKPYAVHPDSGKPLGKYQQLVLKVVEHRQDYEKEKSAYTALEKEDGVVKCFGFWKFNEKEYHFLLEWGSYDLLEFFQLYTPPSTTDGILAFWEGLSSLASALAKIHRLVIQYDDPNIADAIFYMWHCDLKPGNILYCKDGPREGWKIADPGFSTFIDKRGARRQNGRPVVTYPGGTNSYGGPESPIPGKSPIYQAYDIWALGCIFSEAATWLVLGHRAVQLFSLIRRSQTIGDSDLGRRDTAHTLNHDSDEEELPEIHGRDRYHNGVDMSPNVVDWHKHLRRSLRGCDTLTAHILEMIERDMLIGDPLKRKTAPQIADTMRDYITKARHAAETQDSACLGYKPPGYFRDAITIEQERESKIVRKRLTAAGTEPWRDKYKSSAFIEATREPMGRLDDDPDEEPHGSTKVGLGLMHPTTISYRPRPVTPQGPTNKRQSSPPPSVLDRSKQTDTSSGKLRINYLQARELLERAGWVSGTLELPDSARSECVAQAAVASDNTSVIPQSDEELGHHKAASPTTPVTKSHRKGRWSLSSSIKKGKGMSRYGLSLISTIAITTPAVGDEILSPAAVADQITRAASTSMLRLSESHRYTAIDSWFRGRDIAFLIDNGTSMKRHWLYARDLVSVLVALLYGQDDDGIELYFTSSKKEAGIFNEPRQFIDAMNAHAPKVLERPSADVLQSPHASDTTIPNTGASTLHEVSSTAPTTDANAEDIRVVLGDVLARWSEGYSVKQKKLTLIILTDGVWAGVGSKDTVATEIIRSIERGLDNKSLNEQLNTRGLSIQFVRFGHDQAAIKELDWMDDSLTSMRGNILPDIIDHEPADGDVCKMILGSLDHEYDGQSDTRQSSSVNLADEDWSAVGGARALTTSYDDSNNRNYEHNNRLSHSPSAYTPSRQQSVKSRDRAASGTYRRKQTSDFGVDGQAGRSPHFGRTENMETHRSTSSLMQ